MAGTWFADARAEREGWRLDIVSLLAVIGESSMEGHSQTLTSSWTCLLPRIIPAPQTLLKASRPTRMPQFPSAVVGIYNGTLVSTLNFFPNIIHPLDDLPPFSFKVYEIKHKDQTPPPSRTASTVQENNKAGSASTSVDVGGLESGEPTPLRRRKTTFQKIQESLTGETKPHIPTQSLSPLNVLSVTSFLLTIGLLVWAILIQDGTAVLALVTISMASSIIGYASWWSPVLTKRVFHSKVPDGDVAIRTREGAFIIVKCNENVARELYTGTEECKYYCRNKPYRVLVGFGTFLLMVSVVLLGNCDFPMQAAIGGSYIVLNGAFWMVSLMKKDWFWDLSIYEWKDVTPIDAQNADITPDHATTMEEKASFTRTMWYAIRETKRIGWVKKSGAAPDTPQWDQWLRDAEANALANNRKWNAVQQREEVVGLLDNITVPDSPIDTVLQHAPAIEVPPPAMR
ncbi:Uncharacterized protein BP5553_03928 [Venustampulla echinocandica]|uniref:Uncharacterized protein n=1 Tax=Venustampulla echinocandica TaxID=2656787 RepID=A0A370TVU0_9HELO|nr:Uncharacterized protein BP5553_03928 [Venustampulla echinocandica]RDL39588.1 Uncharacterized protein BP5553_03928 [Venustampulla echinocandica]